MSMLKKLWPFIGGTVLVLTGVAAAFYIHERLTAPTVDLKGTVFYSALHLPPDYWNAWVPPDSSFADSDSGEWNYAQHMAQQEAIAAVLKDFSDFIRFGKYSLIRGFWKIELVNEGKRIARQVKLSVPFGKFGLVTREGDRTKFNEITGVLDIGDIDPTEGLSIIVWTSLDDPPTSITQSLEIRHSDGVGELELLEPTGKVGRFAERSVGHVIPSILAFIIAAGIVSLVSYLESKQKTSETGRRQAGD